MEQQNQLTIGLDLACVTDYNTSINTAAEAGFHQVYVPVSHPRYKREFAKKKIIENYESVYTRSMIGSYAMNYSRLIVAKLNNQINVDSKDTKFRSFSEKTIEQDIKWCSYLSIGSIVVTLPSQGSFVNLSRIINSYIRQPHSNIYMIRVPMISNLIAKNEICKKNKTKDDSWERWSNFRSYCGNDKKIKLALDITDDLPDDAKIARWLGEPIGCAFLKTRTFLTNQGGFPVLSKAHQKLLLELLKRRVPIVITDSIEGNTYTNHIMYIQHLLSSVQSNDSFSEFVNGYEDFLQIPLQPLMDNLDQYTYEVFEKDPVKYREYQRAIKLALIDKKNEAIASGEDSPRLVVMVVGAGRGPIVNCALRASEEASVSIKLYAIEKNPHAIVSLNCQKLGKWHDDVTIVNIDMRKWNAPEKADVIVSELLGSFSDNELSPECLDGAQKFLKDNGISIPSSYSSYICPTQSHKIYGDIVDCSDRDKPPYHKFEQPYVVHLQSVYQIAPVKKLFTFYHPNKSEIIDNTRFKTLTFEVTEDSVMHGFSGFFDTVLYKEVVLSIVPETHSEGMFSWFPIFFPLKTPITLKKNDKVSISVWRLMDEKNVWYEWLVDSPVSGAIQNPNGRSYFIGLT